MDKEVKILYDSLLKSGELSSILPGAKKDWEKDKNKFEAYYIQNQDILNDTEIDEPDEYYEEY